MIHEHMMAYPPDGLQEENTAGLFQSDFYEIKFWKYNSLPEGKIIKGYTDNFCITYVNSGNFLFHLFRQCYNLHTGYVLIDKPRCEFSLPPAEGESSVFRFYPQSYLQLFEEAELTGTYFFSNPNLLSLTLKSIPETDYLHHRILRNRLHPEKLETDMLVIEFLNCIIRTIKNEPLQNEDISRLKPYHTAAIERAKEYMHTHFSKDISLKEIAAHACVSPFHFSRVFKSFTSFSPHRYLLNIRLKHAEMLLKSSGLPVSEVASLSGFSSPEHFATSFKRKFNSKPNEYRKL